MKLNFSEKSVLIFAGVVFGVTSIVLTCNFDDFKSTLRGVAYEGLVFASFLALILRFVNVQKEARRKELLLKEKRQAKDSLIKIISILCEAYHEGGTFHWTKLIKNADTFEVNFEAFKSSKKKSKKELEKMLSEKDFRNSCEQNLPIVLAHIPIAEKISPEHLNIWVGICSVVSLTASEAVFSDFLLDEFEEHVTAFAKLPAVVIE
ncbi:hypothetical protein GCM10010919_14540 [Alishewanella longhuensis]|uniref:SMODS and SLOG-associating 2TM effector domain-containing protein n=1 Tax=Alishewanella longhuensis TaxID=1091037 RepID=A0ABQ3KX93_9ALTE|nr:hypothetical protein [Alishewanella longhuensis]GHG66653.1 hypothetical protein GCM10010919_14540 [Alishewanella longhuensis]